MSEWVRKFHRWISVLFTLTVVLNFVFTGIHPGHQPPPAVTYSPLAPLFFLLFSGLYLFVLPYLGKSRNAH